jgi:hypothetical protein
MPYPYPTEYIPTRVNSEQEAQNLPAPTSQRRHPHLCVAPGVSTLDQGQARWHLPQDREAHRRSGAQVLPRRQCEAPQAVPNTRKSNPTKLRSRPRHLFVRFICCEDRILMVSL